MKPARVILAAITLLAAFAPGLFSQAKKNPVQWELSVDPAAAPPGGKFLVKLKAVVDPEYHMYSLTNPGENGLPTVFAPAANPAIQDIQIFQPLPEKKLDPNYNVATERYVGEVYFYLQMQLAASAVPGPVEIGIPIKYSACTDKFCLPYRKLTVTGTITVDPKTAPVVPAIPSGYQEVKRDAPASASGVPAHPNVPQQQQPWGPFLLVAFAAGLAAIFTPCVFPMIPITLSFFLNGEGVTRGESVKQAAIFSIGIVLLFSALGVSIAALVGPFGVVQLASNPWVNGFITLVFLVFGLSLLGAFEITLPASLVNKMDQASRRGGLLGTLLMGLTFALTSFACVGPFVGTLLAASVQQGGAQPLLGMVTFATGLASPFFLLALFPAYLQRLPRSGGWLVRVKVVLGFIVLAVMLKYIGSIDQVLQWNVLTRERFLAAWFVLFALPGLYLLGFLRLEGIDRDEPLGVKRLLIGAMFLIFSFSLLPGMFGRPLGELDAYVPLAAAGASNPAGQAGPVWLKNQYKEALDKARQENKFVLVSFTGYACTNCHWMKANMFTRPEIAAALNNLVVVELYTDGTDAVSEQNQALQEKKFATVAIPFYAILTPDEKVIASWGGIQRNASEFLAFLTSK